MRIERERGVPHLAPRARWAAALAWACMLLSGPALSQNWWSETLDNEAIDYLAHAVHTNDGRFLVAGTIHGDGIADGWMVKLDQNGWPIWQKEYVLPQADTFRAVTADSFGGYVAVGSTTSYGAGGSDFWVVRTDGAGNVLWEHAYGGEQNDWATAVIELEGYYIVAGVTESFGPQPGQNIWLLLLNPADGYIPEWDRTGDTVIDAWGQIAIGGTGDDVANALLALPADGDFLVVGGTTSFGRGGWDFWVLRFGVQISINAEWESTYGGPGFEVADTAALTTTGIVIGGIETTWSDDSGNMWVIKINPLGGVIWERTYGRLEHPERARSIIETDPATQRLMVAGYADMGGLRGIDYWLLNLNPATGLVNWDKVYNCLNRTDEPNTVLANLDGGFLLAGDTSVAFPNIGYDWWVLKLLWNGDVRPGGGPACQFGPSNLPNIATNHEPIETLVPGTYTHVVPDEGEEDVLDSLVTPVYLCKNPP